MMEDDHLQEPENDRPGREVIVMLAVFFEAGLAPLSLILGWIFGHPPLEHFAWNMNDAVARCGGDRTFGVDVSGDASLADRAVVEGQGLL